MNIFINNLILKNLNDNFNIIPITNFKIKHFFFNIFIYKSTSNFIFSQNQLITLNFYKINFKKFLKTSIIINNNLILNENFKNVRKEFLKGSIQMKDCIFSDNKNSNLNGSSIYSTVSLELLNCQFENCYSQFGGAIFIKNLINLTYVSFINCESILNSGAIDIRSNNFNSSIQFCLFNKISSKYFGSIYRYSTGEFNLNSNNFTKSIGKDCVGCIENLKGNLILKFSTFYKCGANVHNGCLVFRELFLFELYFSNFIQNYHNSNEQIAAAVLLIYKNPIDSSIKNCNFNNNIPSNSFTVCIYQCQSIIINECCFTGNRYKEFKADPNPIEFDNIFDNKCVIKNKLKSIGYLLNRKYKKEINPIWIFRFKGFILALFISFLFFNLLFRLFPFTYKFLFKNLKDEKLLM